MLKKLQDWLVCKWDWWIYLWAFNSFRRLCKHNQGFAYLFELHMRDYLSENPISEQLKSATETFYAEMRDSRLSK